MPTHQPRETTPENIHAIAAELARCGIDLQAAAEGMKSCGFDQLEVVNFGVLKKAVFGANSYVKAVKDAIWAAREERGDFGTSGPGNKKGSGKGRKSTRVRVSPDTRDAS